MTRKEEILDEVRRLGQEFDSTIWHLGLSPEQQIDEYNRHKKKMDELSAELELYRVPTPHKQPIVEVEKKEYIPKRTPEMNTKNNLWDTPDLEKKHPERFDIGFPHIIEGAYAYPAKEIRTVNDNLIWVKDSNSDIEPVHVGENAQIKRKKRKRKSRSRTSNQSKLF